MPPLVFSRTSTADVLALLNAQALTLRLYTAPLSLQVTDVFATFVEASGGGYAAIPLNSLSWTVTPGSPSVALYSAFQVFTFTGPVTVPEGIRGYYLTNASNVVRYAEQLFADGSAFVPFLGAVLRIRPRYGADNLAALPPVIP